MMKKGGLSSFQTNDNTKNRPTRRSFIKGGLATLALTSCEGPWIKTSKNREQLRWLGWEHYDVPVLREEFEQKYGVAVSAGYFDGNSEAYTRLKAGGTREFDLVMADGFWPRLYDRQGLTQALDDSRLSALTNVFPDFLPPRYGLLHNTKNNRIAAPNCWGGYGLTSNISTIDQRAGESLGVLFDQKYADHIATSARYEENIALAGILACHRLGTIDESRPDGQPFNPYVLYDEELQKAQDLLIKQKRLLLLRWNDEDTLERLLRSESVWVSPEWSGIYRRIYFDWLDGETDLQLRHVLRPEEGGLGWVDTWAITSGVTEPVKLELAYEWINFRLQPENMALIAREIGWSPTVDVRSLLEQRYIDALFLDKTDSIKALYQFDIPSSTEKWERVWAEVQAA